MNGAKITITLLHLFLRHFDNSPIGIGGLRRRHDGH